MAEQVRSKPDESAPITQMELVEHLAELRARVIRSLVYTCIGTAIGWSLYGFFFKLLSAPVTPLLEKSGSSFLITGVAEGFAIKMQMSLLVGLILAMPLVTLEGWRFLAPALTPKEKKGVRLVAPLSVLLFIAGVYVAYHALPMGIGWLTSQNPPEAAFMPSVQQTLLFILKMCLAFGIVFQMPVVLMFLAKIGIVTSATLKAGWRHAAVIIAFIAALVTPSGDAFTMFMLFLPMVGLYGLSIILTRAVEPR